MTTMTRKEIKNAILHRLDNWEKIEEQYGVSIEIAWTSIERNIKSWKIGTKKMNQILRLHDDEFFSFFEGNIFDNGRTDRFLSSL